MSTSTTAFHNISYPDVGTEQGVWGTILNQAIEAIAATLIPVGTILAWHKSLTGTPPLSSRFLECNGQVVSDIESPLDGQTLPDLNGQARFLRGSSASGTLQDDAFQGHHHDIYYTTSRKVEDTGAVNYRQIDDTPTIIMAGDPVRSPVTDGVNGTPRTASETRSLNMSVVFIICIK